MNILEAKREAIAKSRHGRGWDRSFTLVDGDGSEIPCTWKDPHFGLFLIDGVDGLIRIDDVPAGFSVRGSETVAPGV